jgi:hypothetical protein
LCELVGVLVVGFGFCAGALVVAVSGGGTTTKGFVGDVEDDPGPASPHAASERVAIAAPLTASTRRSANITRARGLA